MVHSDLVIWSYSAQVDLLALLCLQEMEDLAVGTPRRWKTKKTPGDSNHWWGDLCFIFFWKKMSNENKKQIGHWKRYFVWVIFERIHFWLRFLRFDVGIWFNFSQDAVSTRFGPTRDLASWEENSQPKNWLQAVFLDNVIGLGYPCMFSEIRTFTMQLDKWYLLPESPRPQQKHQKWRTID